MFGVPIDGPADVFCDNQSVVTNVGIPSSVLIKKHSSVFYHRLEKHIQMVRYKLDGYQVSIMKLILIQRQQYLRRDDMSYWIRYLMRRFLQLQRNHMEMMLKLRSPHLWRLVSTSCTERNRRWKQVQRMSFEWINETVARTPTHLRGLS